MHYGAHSGHSYPAASCENPATKRRTGATPGISNMVSMRAHFTNGSRSVHSLTAICPHSNDVCDTQPTVLEQGSGCALDRGPSFVEEDSDIVVAPLPRRLLIWCVTVLGKPAYRRLRSPVGSRMPQRRTRGLRQMQCASFGTPTRHLHEHVVPRALRIAVVRVPRVPRSSRIIAGDFKDRSGANMYPCKSLSRLVICHPPCAHVRAWHRKCYPIWLYVCVLRGVQYVSVRHATDR